MNAYRSAAQFAAQQTYAYRLAAHLAAQFLPLLVVFHSKFYQKVLLLVFYEIFLNFSPKYRFLQTFFFIFLQKVKNWAAHWVANWAAEGVQPSLQPKPT
jgi:hypothetical protein